ncbi:MAG TPA: hypothetical protein VE526_07975 [Solirubrobacteraceae bacterium]|jgi:hypothetical protein|nr:hypothetical protein [Solirubrobacteraceae bacterium]
MPSTPPPLWPGYDEASEEDLLSLLDTTESAAHNPDDDTVRPNVVGGLATAIAEHEAIKKELDPDNYRARLHDRANVIAGGWQP